MDKPFVIQVVGYKNAGKTTLATALIKQFVAAGYRVGSIKHDAHQFEIDSPETDTGKLRQAGAAMVAITSAAQTALLMDGPLSLEQLLVTMASMDVVVVEGFKTAHYPKLVLVRNDLETDLLQLPAIEAVVYDRLYPPTTHVTWQRDQIQNIFDEIMKRMN